MIQDLFCRMQKAWMLLTIRCLILGSLIATAQSAQADPHLARRGKYLVESVAICFECHSERNYDKRGWPVAKGAKGGGRIFSKSGNSVLVASNITPDNLTGIGNWSDAEILRALRDGVGKDGQKLDPEMPSKYFARMAEEDLHAIVVYLRSIKPVRHSLPRSQSQDEQSSEMAMDRLTLPPSKDVRNGEYLARVATCETCHTPSQNGKFLVGLEYAGGVPISHEKYSATSTNITPAPSGIFSYDENLFIQVMTTGRVGARKLSPIMPWYFYRGMKRDDLHLLYSYFRAIPAVNHQVNNSEPATSCRKCGYRHGNGDKN